MVGVVEALKAAKRAKAEAAVRRAVGALGGAGLTVTVETNAPDVAADMQNLVERQLPFATALALTRLAADVVAGERAYLSPGKKPGGITVRSRRILAGVGMRPARKADWPRPQAVVGHRDAFLVPQELGGIKRAEKGARHVAIPLRVVTTRRTSTGAVPRRLKPRQLLAKKGASKSAEAIAAPLSAAASATGRKESARFYFLRSQVRIRPRLQFRDVAAREAGARYDARFREALDQAVRSARVRSGRFTSEQGRAVFLRAVRRS